MCDILPITHPAPAAKYVGESGDKSEMIAAVALCQGYDNKKALKILNKSRLYSCAWSPTNTDTHARTRTIQTQTQAHTGTNTSYI